VKNGVVKLKTMKLRILLASRISKRLARAARSYRRDLRDHLRNETARIRKLEIRSRGLRLYAAWASGVSNAIQTRAENWYQVAPTQAAGGYQLRSTALLNRRSYVL
jgi:hypothetical protein